MTAATRGYFNGAFLPGWGESILGDEEPFLSSQALAQAQGRPAAVESSLTIFANPAGLLEWDRDTQRSPRHSLRPAPVGGTFPHHELPSSALPDAA